jgi:ArsR family transcriptional regulator
MRKIAELFKALSEETRLEIMALLSIGGELCVCDFEGVLGISQSKSSRHLRYLYNAGLVLNRREGKWMYYRLPEAPATACAQLLEALETLINRSQRAALRKRLEAWLRQKDREALASCAPRTTRSGGRA